MIPERITWLMNEGVENPTMHFDFCWPRVLRLKNTVGSAPALYKQLQQKVQVRGLGVALGALRREARFEAIVSAAEGRPCLLH